MTNTDQFHFQWKLATLIKPGKG